MKKYQIFISSVQKEFRNERRALKAYIDGDALLSHFFDVFLFEDIPASDRPANKVYLGEVRQCDIYLGLFGDHYGIEDDEGISPTHREFILATELNKTRLIFVKGSDDNTRQSKMKALIYSAGSQLIRRRFADSPELHSAVYASLVQYLLDSGKLLTAPFDASACRNAEFKDISTEKVRWFLSRAKNARDYALAETTAVIDVLTHLNLLDQNRPNHAAILLFGLNPQRFLVTSEVKCMHFHGVEKHKPIPSYQIYKGTVFDLVDRSVDFVMSKLNRSVGTRKHGPQAPVEYDIPQEVVSEGIVNAVAHRNYNSNASVEIILFSDRLEIWNPGTLPPSLTIESLRKPHSSQPENPLISEPLFLTKYIEKAGTGTVDMYEHCNKAGIRPPEFRLEGGFFILTVWRKNARKEKYQSKSRLGAESGVESGVESVAESEMAYTILSLLKKTSIGKKNIANKLGKSRPSRYLNELVTRMIYTGMIEYTIPNKPNSRLQKYRLTTKGRRYLQSARKRKK